MFFDHVTIRVTNRAATEPVYERLMGVLGHARTKSGEWNDFSLAEATADKPTTRRLHIGFRAGSRALVDEFWRAGLDAGWRDDGEPGPRPEYREDYYGGFLLDPDGNSIEAVHHGGIADEGSVDHVWLRVADLEQSRRFYSLAGRFGHFEPRAAAEGRVHFVGPRPGGSFSIVAGTPTEEAHLAFPAPDTDTVEAFHAALVESGYRDNGAPGERPEYHPGYYAAFVLDPDGNNIELVLHS